MYTRLWLGGGQSEPYSWTCMPKKHTSAPSTSSKANRAFILYGKDSDISPLSTNLEGKEKPRWGKRLRLWQKSKINQRAIILNMFTTCTNDHLPGLHAWLDLNHLVWDVDHADGDLATFRVVLPLDELVHSWLQIAPQLCLRKSCEDSKKDEERGGIQWRTGTYNTNSTQDMYCLCLYSLQDRQSPRLTTYNKQGYYPH